jgi:hypothetical protein
MDRWINGSPDGRMAGSPDGRMAGSPDGRITGSLDHRIVGSPTPKLNFGEPEFFTGIPFREKQT